MRNALLLLTAALVIASCGGGGGGGGSSSAGGNNPPPPPSPQSSYPTVRGNLYYSSADAVGNLFGIDYVCAVYRDTGQWIADVPVRDNCVRVENNAFTMHLSGAGDYALFFFNATASPIGFAGKDGGVYVLHLGDGNTTLSIYLEQDAQGQVEGDVAEKSLIVSDDDYFFNNDSDGDGVRDVVDPDWLTQRFLKVKFINVSLLQKEQGLFIDNSTENDNDPVPVYYYLNIRNAVEPMGFISFEGNSTLTSAVNMVQQGEVFIPYLIPTDEDANLIFSEGYYDLTVPKLAAYREVIPVFVAPSPLNPTFDDYEALKNNVLYAIADWNNYIRQADPQAGFVFLGAVPYVNGTLSCGQGPTVDNVTDKAPIPGSVVVFRGNPPLGLGGNTNRVDSCSLPEPVSALVSIQTNNATLTSSYLLQPQIHTVGIVLERQDTHAVVHELGHAIGLEHPFEHGYGYIPSVMNYPQYNRTQDISDFDAQLVEYLYGNIVDFGFSADGTGSAYQDWADSNAPVSLISWGE